MSSLTNTHARWVCAVRREMYCRSPICGLVSPVGDQAGDGLLGRVRLAQPNRGRPRGKRHGLPGSPPLSSADRLPGPHSSRHTGRAARDARPARRHAGGPQIQCRRGPSVAVREKPTVRTDRPGGSDAVRYTSVTIATHRPAVTHADTRRDKKEMGPRVAFPQPGGRFGWWWQVLGSNQRRLSRRFTDRSSASFHIALELGNAPNSIRRTDAVRRMSVNASIQARIARRATDTVRRTD